MTEILLIHDISDEEAVDRLADEITKAGVTVGKFASVMEQHRLLDVIGEARAVIVVWSPTSASSKMVLNGAALAQRHGKLVALRTREMSVDAIPLAFRQLLTPLIDDWDAIGQAISAMFEANAGAGGASANAPAPEPPPLPMAAPAAPIPAPAPAPAPPPLPASSTPSAAVTAAAATEDVEPASIPAPQPAPPPPPAAASPVYRPEGVGAAAPNPIEGIGAASDGPFILDKAWRLERELRRERTGTSVTFGKPMPSAARPASLTFDELQRARGAAQGSTDRPRSPASLSDVFPDPDVVVDDVDCSVFAPPVARIGARIMVQVFLHRIEQAERAQFLAETMDDTAKLRGMETLQLPIPRRTRVTVELDGRGLKVSEPMRSLLWHGQPTVAAFEVEVPQDFDGEVCHPVARVLVEGEPVGRILFQIRIEPATRDAKTLPAPELGGTSAKAYQYAFLSYASKDRAEVLKRAQAFQAAKLAFFQDVLSLEPGQRYSEEILHRIGKADLFVLFWSRHAKRSEWVQKEIDHALACQRNDPSGLPDIVPIMLEPIAKAPPPPGIAHLHHNAPINTLIAAEQPSLLRRLKEWVFGM